MSTGSPAASRAELDTAGRQLELFRPDPAGVAVSVRRSRRARRLSIHVLPHGLVEVVAPVRVSPGEVEALVAASRDWLEKTLSRIDLGSPAASLSLPNVIHLPATGMRWGVHYAGGVRASVASDTDRHGRRLTVGGDDAAARRSLREWLLAEGRGYLPGRVDAIAGRTGLHPAAVTVRRQRTRWGSCSARRRISLNCALLFLPSDLVDYLIVHELCHLRHMNHSRRFWDLVRSFRPDSDARERALSRAWSRVPGWVFYDA